MVICGWLHECWGYPLLAVTLEIASNMIIPSLSADFEKKLLTEREFKKRKSKTAKRDLCRMLAAVCRVWENGVLGRIGGNV